MAMKHESTKKLALDNARATKKDKGRMLTEATAITEWSRGNARSQLKHVAKLSRTGETIRRASPEV